MTTRTLWRTVAIMPATPGWRYLCHNHHDPAKPVIGNVAAWLLEEEVLYEWNHPYHDGEYQRIDVPKTRVVAGTCSSEGTIQPVVMFHNFWCVLEPTADSFPTEVECLEACKQYMEE